MIHHIDVVPLDYMGFSFYGLPIRFQEKPLCLFHVYILKNVSPKVCDLSTDHDNPLPFTAITTSCY